MRIQRHAAFSVPGASIAMFVAATALATIVFTGWSTPSRAGDGPPLPGAPASGFVPVPGGRVFYEAAGQGTTVVMTHDGLLHRETWDAPFGALQGGYRVIRWDRRGYGKSDRATAPYFSEDDLLAVLDALKVERAVLIGCSAGSLLTLHFALDHPDRAAALVLVGPIVSGLPFSDHFKTRGGHGKPGDDAPFEQKLEYWTARDPWIMAPGNATARARMRALLKANPQNLAPSDLEEWRGPAALGRLSQVKVPTLLIVGESDIPDVHAHVGAIEAGISGARRVVLPRSGHLPQIEVPEEFDRVLMEFLRTIPPPAAAPPSP